MIRGRRLGNIGKRGGGGGVMMMCVMVRTVVGGVKAKCKYACF